METRLTSNIKEAAHLLRSGEVVAIPTETVYGLAANALNPHTVAQVFRLKERPFSDPLIVHVRNREAVEKLGIPIPDWARLLMEKFWPGPLTILLPHEGKIPSIVTAGLPRVALRAPAHPLTQALLEEIDFPLAAPSANPFARISPTQPSHVWQYFEGKIPLILDGGPCRAGLESTIVGEEEGRFVLYRPGAISREALEAVLGTEIILPSPRSAPQAPGQFPRHYAPVKPLFYGWEVLPDEPEASLISFTPTSVCGPHAHLLTRPAKLYDTLHQCEGEPTKFILVQRVPLTFPHREAVEDRLRRAASPFVLTIGHSTHSAERFLSLLARYGVSLLIDVRKAPYSRYVPHFSYPILREWLEKASVAYLHLPAEELLMQTLSEQLKDSKRIVLMCAEGEPRRCHRFALADRLSQKGIRVLHILPEGRLSLHIAPISWDSVEKV
ncbi:MAG: L-threonylcarbamoyladenylate synthase [Bacteroidia bacterium]|nr:L-threonylcarbamoyladenylate synthase [Bacteroidia bacterium]MDW8235523.1 L-threonylcarbamoyladenylate synthase [Bacteroidia bacterium]